MWFQFRDERNLAQVNGLITSVTLADGTLADDVVPTYYVQNDNSAPPFGMKRFDGPAFPPDYENWHTNPFITDQVDANSILNWTDEPRLMLHRQSVNGQVSTSVALLGALTGPASEQVYSLQIETIDYSIGSGPVIGDNCYFGFVPEPGGAMLVGACALRLRRRRH